MKKDLESNNKSHHKDYDMLKQREFCFTITDNREV